MKQKIDEMLKDNFITAQKYRHLANDLQNQGTTFLYGLPAIHKIFDSFQPIFFYMYKLYHTL